MTSPVPVPRLSVRQWTRAERVRAGVAYWLFVAACLVIAAGGLYLVRLENTPVRNAQPVPATVEHVETISRDDGHGHAAKVPLVIYSYTVNGVRYTTDRLTSLGRQHAGSWTTDMMKQFHPGQTVTAYVAKLDPGSAYLIRDYDWRAYAFLIIPIVAALALALYWPWAGIRQPASR
jgi:hypothetical protein